MGSLEEFGTICVDASNLGHNIRRDFAKGDCVSTATTKSVEKDNSIPSSPVSECLESLRASDEFRNPICHVISDNFGSDRIPSFGIELNATVKSCKKATVYSKNKMF